MLLIFGIRSMAQAELAQHESKLFMAVDDEVMPSAEDGEDPLPANEREVIRRWILVGAPTEDGITPK